MIIHFLLFALFCFILRFAFAYVQQAKGCVSSAVRALAILFILLTIASCVRHIIIHG